MQRLFQENNGSSIRLDMEKLFFGDVTSDNQGFLFLHSLPGHPSHLILTQPLENVRRRGGDP
jgi:hypothetical protein